jgi:hypothetical protein
MDSIADALSGGYYFPESLAKYFIVRYAVAVQFKFSAWPQVRSEDWGSIAVILMLQQDDVVF